MAVMRYGDDRALSRATRRAAVHVGVALLVTAVFVLLSVALVAAKFGFWAAIHGGGGLLSTGLSVVHWWGALLILLGAVVIVTIRLLRAAPEPSMPRTAYDLEQDHPARDALARLAALADMPVPALRVVPSTQLNAFVVDDPDLPVTVLLTEGALYGLTPDELEAVLAHELFHVAHGDTRLTRRLEQVADIAEQRAPRFASGYVLRAVRSMMRQRELSADRHAALLTGHPSVLLAAVQRCDASEGGAMRDLREVATVGFVASEPGYAGPGTDTHPSIPERAEVLARVASSLGS
jgi:heat shock protein HtpX